MLCTEIVQVEVGEFFVYKFVVFVRLQPVPFCLQFVDPTCVFEFATDDENSEFGKENRHLGCVRESESLSLLVDLSGFGHGHENGAPPGGVVFFSWKCFFFFFFFFFCVIVESVEFWGAIDIIRAVAEVEVMVGTMEAGLPVAMDTLSRWPALLWAMVSALVLFWGTGLIASKRLIKQGVKYPTSWMMILKRQITDGFWICAEEALFADLALLNVIAGVAFWILDFYHEGRPPPNANYFPLTPQLSRVPEPDLRNPEPQNGTDTPALRPKRAGIFRPRNVKGNVCGCWGYQVPEDGVYADGIQVEEEEDVKPVQPRWSDCQCAECTVLLMTPKDAYTRLFVRCEDTLAGGERCTNFRGMETEVITDAGSNLKPMFASSEPNPNLQHNTPTRDSTAVIFLHGLFSSSSFWFDTNLVPRMSDEIKAQHRILAPDLLGCGRSPRPVDCAYTVADHIQALEKSIIQRHGLESFHLVAHSMGCIFALVLAAKYPDRVRSITLIAPVYPPGDFDETGKLARLPCASIFGYLQPFTVKGIRGLLVSKYYNLSRAVAHLFYARHRFWVSYLHKKWKRFPLSFIADYITNHHDAAWHMTHNSLLGGTHAVVPALIKLQKHQKRIFVYHGVDDTSCQITCSREMQDRFSNVELHEVRGHGHVDVLWKRAEEPCKFIEREILAGDAKFAAIS